MNQVRQYSLGLARQIQIITCVLAFLVLNTAISKGAQTLAPTGQELQQQKNPAIVVSESRRGQIVAAVKSARAEDVPELQRRSEQGDPEAQWQLGLMYLDGHAVEKSPVTGVFWIRKAAEQGHPGAQSSLGYAYREGVGVAQDHEESLRWYRKAADQNYAQGQCNVGLSYVFGNGVPKDPPSGVQWFKLASEQENACGLVWLGLSFADGTGVPKDPARAVELFRKAAERGDAKGQFYLALAYDGGRGILKNSVEAARWYRSAAEQNELEAMFNLAFFFFNGEGVPQSLTNAEIWFRKASDAGWAPASYCLGNLYADKKIEDGRKTASTAMQLYEKSAEQGFSLAALTLSDMYSSQIAYRNRLTSTDDLRACRWLMVTQALTNPDRWASYRPDDSATVSRLLPERISSMQKKFKQRIEECEQWAADWMKAHPSNPGK